MATTEVRQQLKRVVQKGSAIALDLLASDHDRRVVEWYALGGEDRLKYEFDLDQDSIVMDVGGYRGQWASDIYSRYCCNIYVYEPVPDYAEYIRHRFVGNPDITLVEQGLSASSRVERVHVQADASTALASGVSKSDSLQVMAKFTAITEAIDALNTDIIDLMKLNIEGGEYDVLGALLDREYIGRIRNILIQFHDFVPEAERRRDALCERLGATHRQCFCVPFIWESWSRKGE